MPIELIARIGSIFLLLSIIRIVCCCIATCYANTTKMTESRTRTRTVGPIRWCEKQTPENNNKWSQQQTHFIHSVDSTLLEVGWWKKIAIAIGFCCQYRRRYIACCHFLLGCCCLSICLSFFFRLAWLLTLGLCSDYAFNELKYAVLYGACARPSVRTPFVFILNVQNLCEPMRIMRLALLHPFRWYN